MVKYSLSTRDLPRADPEGTPEDSGCTSPYILLKFKLRYYQFLKIKLKELILCIALVAEDIFSSIAQ